MTKPKHLLVLRLSSLGDVAMTVPVIRNLLQDNLGLQITVVSAGPMEPLFQNTGQLNFFAADVKGRHKGLVGLYRLYKDLSRIAEFDAVADLHDVLRTKILQRFFSFSKIPVASIDKGRKEKEELTRPRHKKLRPLKSTFQRYADVFIKLGLRLSLDIEPGLCPRPDMPGWVSGLHKAGYVFIGIAPVAYYAEKTYPLDKMKEVVRLLLADEKNVVFLFGGRAESALFESWREEFPTIVPMGENLRYDLAVMANINVMVSMDSANMHLASLFGVPVVSVWGGTHPYLGFMGWGQSVDNAVQIDLPCRPSSVFGNKACPNQCACMTGIPPQMIYDKVMQQLRSAK